MAFCWPSKSILSKYFLSWINFFISFEIGSIFSIKTCESLAKNGNLVTLLKPGTGYKKISIKEYYGLKVRNQVIAHLKDDGVDAHLAPYLKRDIMNMLENGLS